MDSIPVQKIQLDHDVIFTYTRLGEPIFIKPEHTNALYGIRTMEWSPKQLRVMADYMEANPNCTLMSDGSGKSLI